MARLNDLTSYADLAPIFIVGSPRSGTTLLSAMLSGHSNLSCGPETQFFSKLRKNTLDEAIGDENWPSLAIESLLSLTLSEQPVYSLFGETRDSLSKYLTAQKPSITSMLEALCLSHAFREDKTRWVEKTPNHILHLEKIRELYPEARIIRIMRDPRDSAISMAKLPWTSDSFVTNSYLWMEWYELSRNFLESDALSISVRYEDILQKPTQKLVEICEFIGEKFEQKMLNTAETGAKVSTIREPWKAQVSKPLDISRMYAWKKCLSTDLQIFAAVFFNSALEKYGYEDFRPSNFDLPFHPSTRDAITQNGQFIVAAALSGTKLIPCRETVETDRLLYLTISSQFHRMSSLLTTALFLIKRNIRGKYNYYIKDKTLPVGYFNRIHRVIVWVFARSLNVVKGSENNRL